jgi:membrane protein DedA with SNARE-associated domain
VLHYAGIRSIRAGDAIPAPAAETARSRWLPCAAPPLQPGDDARMSAGLPGPLAAVGPLLDHHGYVAVAGLVFVESFGVPAPAQTLLIVAGVYAGEGRLNLALVALVGFAAAVLGDSLGFWIGRLGGRRLVLRVGHFVLLTEDRLNEAERYFHRHGGKIVVVARFFDGLRQFNGIVAGVVNMPWWRFLACNALGAAVWASVWSSAGFLAGEHIARIYEVGRRYQPLVLAALAATVTALVARWVWRRARRSGARMGTGAGAREPGRP